MYKGRPASRNVVVKMSWESSGKTSQVSKLVCRKFWFRSINRTECSDSRYQFVQVDLYLCVYSNRTSQRIAEKEAAIYRVLVLKRVGSKWWFQLFI